MKLTDNQNLISATSRFGHKILTYNDGYGPLWIHRDSTGISGIVRAKSWGTAYSICEDEFFPEATDTVDELIAEYGFRREHRTVVKAPGVSPDEPDYVEAGHRYVRDTDYVNGRLPAQMFAYRKTIETPDPEAWTKNELFCEAYGFRPSGPRAGKWEDGTPRDPMGHGIYAKDLNGDSLEILTDELIADLGVTLVISNYWEVEVGGYTTNLTIYPYSGDSEGVARAMFLLWAGRNHPTVMKCNDVLVAEHKPIDE